jgi:hypothetical protein
LIVAVALASSSNATHAVVINIRPKDGSIIATVSALTAGVWPPLLDHSRKKP